MEGSIKYFLFLTLLIGVFGCSKKGKEVSVTFYGQLHTIMSGDIEAKFSLSEINNDSDIYALGAVEKLKGEIQIFKGKPLISSLKGQKIYLDSSFNYKATLLVYARVKDWMKIPIPIELKTKEQIEQFVFKAAQDKELNMDKPFPFLIEGMTESLEWHVIDWKENDTAHTHLKHQNAGEKGELKNQIVEVLGFYSRNHKGVFTHRNSESHLHFKNANETLAGHVDQLAFKKGVVLKLPVQ